MKKIRIGLIGTGYIGKTHAIAYRAVSSIFGYTSVVMELVAEVSEELAKKAANDLGFNRYTGDWIALVNDPDVDIVAIATPNSLHKEMALEAIAAGKHVYCEKPLALNAEDAKEMMDAAKNAGVVNMVGYNYLCNPMVVHIKNMIESGAIGEVIHFRGRHNEDYLASNDEPFTWRCDHKLAGAGALGDLGSHIISMARYIVGDITSLIADMNIVIADRLLTDGSGTRKVENEDQAHALVHFDGGAIGYLETSRVAHGRKLGLAFEVVGTAGTLVFDQERMNEIQYYDASDEMGNRGFQTIMIDSSHPDFANFCPAAAHGLGYNDQKVIEVQRLLEAVLDGKRPPVDFTEAYKIELIIDAMVKSSREKKWVNLN